MAKKRTQLFLGLLVWLVILTFVIWGGTRAFRFFVPKKEVAVSVNLVFKDAGLVVEGHVLQADALAKSGTVRLTVERRGEPIEVTLYEQIVDGKFETSPIMGFDPEHRIRVLAEAHVPYGEDGKKTLVSTEIARWKYTSAWARGALWIAVGLPLIYFALFLILFTGTWGKKPYKYRLAIIHSYFTAGVFLLLPLSLPALLTAQPDLIYAMQSSPVGVLRVANTTMGEKALPLSQWALNIGGLPVEASPRPMSAGATPSGEEGDAPAEALPKELIRFDIEHGLVVPLYVFILAVLGGAINMTRQVPRLQNALGDLMSSTEFQAAYDVAERGVKAIYKMATFTEEDNADIRRVLDPAQQSALTRVSAQLDMHRADLIRQYMYLFTAPFLAIVAYFMLFLILEDLVSIVPVVVLISFTCGLLSEAVVGTIAASSDAYLARVKLKAGAVTEKVNTPPPVDDSKL